MKKISSHTLSVLAALLLSGSVTFGQNFVAAHFQGDYGGTQNSALKDTAVSESGDFDADGTADDVRSFLPIDVAGAQLMAFTPGLVDRSNRFLGGGQIVNYNSLVAPAFSLIRYNGVSDFFQITSGAGSSDMGMAFAMFVVKEDFLAGSTTPNLSLADVADGFTGQFSFSGTVLTDGGGAPLGLRRARLLVKNGTQWYVSNSTVGSQDSAILVNPYTETWHEYDPATQMFVYEVSDLDTSPVTASVGGSALTDIQAVGVIAQNTRFDGLVNNAVWLQFFGFRVELSGGLELDPLDQFRIDNGLAGDGSEDELAPAADGVSNLFKYAFNMIGAGTKQEASLDVPNNSTVSISESAGLPAITLNGSGELEVLYVRRLASTNPGITYEVQFGDALDDFAANPAATESVVAIDSSLERVTVTDSVSGAASRFARMDVSLEAVAPAPGLAVDFGANYTSTNINSSIAAVTVLQDLDADFDGNIDDRAMTVPFGTVFTPPNSASWTTPAGKSGAVIHHGISVAIIDWVSGVDPEASIQLDRISSADIIQVGNGPGTSSLRMASAFYWEKASFLNGLDGAFPLSFSNESTGISATFNNTGTPTNTGGRLSRVLVQSGGVWYVSESVFGSTTGTISFNGYSTNWFVFDPQTDSLFWDVASPGTAVPGSTFTDISAVGVYTQHELINGTAANAALHGFSGLQVVLAP